MWNIFISHASEDKDDFVGPLAAVLASSGLKVWYDDFELKPGDSLIESIDNGLGLCQKGVVVLSPTFFNKKWPRLELNALVRRHVDEGKVIIPIWYNVDKSQVEKYSALLADIVAIKASRGVEYTAKQILGTLDTSSNYCASNTTTVKVSPTTVKLHTGEWRKKTPVLVYNLGDNPAYSVNVKFTIHNPSVQSESIGVEHEGDSLLRGSAGPIGFDPKMVVVDCIDQEHRQALYIYIHTIEPKASKQIIVHGNEPISTRANIRIMGFQNEPSPIMEQDGKVALPFVSPNEKCTLKGVRMNLSKRY